MAAPKKTQQIIGEDEDGSQLQAPSTGLPYNAESECVQKQARSAKDCINARDGSVPDKCFALLTNFSDCKRSMVDMRSRFRGRKGDV
ncbi:unnamed protein product, partial [Mesorhabditis spiculigera]